MEVIEYIGYLVSRRHYSYLSCSWLEVYASIAHKLSTNTQRYQKDNVLESQKISKIHDASE